MRRALVLGAVLFLAYASTLGLEAFPGSEYGGDEPHYLLAAGSLVRDGDLDVLDDYLERAYAAYYPLELDMHGAPRGGSLHEPHGAGFPALIAPALALGGPRAVELMLAALAALAGALGYALARRVTPDPWAAGAGLGVGLSAPLLAYGSAVYPELAAGAALAGAALLALRLQEGPARGEALACFGLLAALPWLGTKFVPAAVVVGAYATRALWRSERRMLAVVGVELAALGAFAYVLVNERLYGGPTPYAADFAGEDATGAEGPLGHLGRAYRLGALFVDRDYGLVRWAPVLALALLGAWLLVRARRTGLERALPAHHEAQATATLCALAAGAQLLVAAFAAPTMFGFWFPGRHLVAGLPLAVPLVAWGLRRLPRTGATLAALGAIGSIWLYLDVRLGSGSLISGLPSAPWGPLEAAFPFFGDSALPYAVTAAAGFALVFLIALDWRHSRQIAGAARARYSG